jgi:hypothetical protein
LLDPEGINFKIKVFITKEISGRFVKSAEPLKMLFNSEGKLMLPIDIKGSFQKLNITLDMKYIVKIFIQKGLL